MAYTKDFYVDMALAKSRKNDLSLLSRKQELLYQRSRQAHGGVVGTSGKGAIALRFDDWEDDLYATMYPLLNTRSLPWGLALLSRFTTKSYGQTCTWDNIRTMYQNGMEVWSHGTDHLDPTPYGYAGYVDQIVNSRAEIEAQGLKVQGWMNPGIYADARLTDLNPYEGLHDSTGDWDSYDSDVGSLLFDTYPITEAYIWGELRTLPMQCRHGASYVGVESLTLVQLQTYVNRAIKYKLGIEFMTHSGKIGKDGFISLADYTSFLDYLVTKRDAGEIEIVTPSSLYYADPGSTHRLDLLCDNTFDFTTTGWSLASGATIETSGGRTGNNFLRHTNSMTSTTTQRPDGYVNMLLSGETFMFDGWFRSNGASNTTARVIIQDYNENSRLNLSKTKVSNGSTWTHFLIPFSMHPLTNKLTVAIGRSAGDGVDWDDVHVYKA